MKLNKESAKALTFRSFFSLLFPRPNEKSETSKLLLNSAVGILFLLLSLYLVLNHKIGYISPRLRNSTFPLTLILGIRFTYYGIISLFKKIKIKRVKQ